MSENTITFEDLKTIDSPLINQYLSFKEKYNDYILFFQIGEFWELYCEDAILVSSELNLKLTKRTIDKKDIPMCGVPCHSGDGFSNQLAKAGHNVALVGQKKDGENITREIVRIVTPATITEEDFLEKDEHQYIMSLYSIKNEIGCAIVDYLSGESTTTVIDNLSGESTIVRKYGIFDLINRYKPKEVLLYLSQEWEPELIEKIKNLGNVRIYTVPYFYNEMKPAIDEHKLKYFNDKFEKYIVIAAHYFLINHLEKNQSLAVTLRKVNYIQNRDYLYLDASTILNLELFENMQTRKKDKSLLGVLDNTVTPKGSRLLRKWIQEPLLDSNKINMRYALVNYLNKNNELRDNIRVSLSNNSDIERIIARFETNRFKDIELCNFLNTMKAYNNALNLLSKEQQLGQFSKQADILYKNVDLMINRLNNIIDDETIIKEGFDLDFDKIRKDKNEGKQNIENYLEKVREDTGIKKLKLDENKILGYFFEVTKSNLKNVPDYFIERASVSSGRRYVTEELKTLEETYNTAIEQYSIYYRDAIEAVVSIIKPYFSVVKNTIDFIAAMDIMAGFSVLAERKNYKCPKITNTGTINIRNGKHPLLDNYSFTKIIPNNCTLNNEDIQIITGPNMGGKSTYLKMVGMITIMAQIGSFVPGDMEFTPVDRVLVRIGANDALLNNQSTFMMEMEEMSYILYHATPKSLILIDELGRGTSTDDGIAIASACLEYISNKLHSKTICSTHYHELIELDKTINKIRNYHAEVIENKDGIVFTFKIKEGGIPKSFGIEVAKKAGLPLEIIQKSEDYLKKSNK